MKHREDSEDAPTEVIEKPAGKKRRATPDTLFNPDWHDAKEIVVPFDESRFDVQLVSEKEWAAAYAPARAAPQLENLRLETRRTVGRLVDSPGFWDDLCGFFLGLRFFVEAVLMVWTVALLGYGFPGARWPGLTLACAWGVTLIVLRMSFPAWYRAFLWSGSLVTTSCWLAWSPWAGETLVRLASYFFRT